MAVDPEYALAGDMYESIAPIASCGDCVSDRTLTAVFATLLVNALSNFQFSDNQTNIFQIISFPHAERSRPSYTFRTTPLLSTVDRMASELMLDSQGFTNRQERRSYYHKFFSHSR